MGKNLEEINPEIRLEIINMTGNLDRRLENMYHLIENDILSKLMFSPNDISFYKASSFQHSALPLPPLISCDERMSSHVHHIFLPVHALQKRAIRRLLILSGRALSAFQSHFGTVKVL